MRIQFDQLEWQQVAPGLRSKTFEQQGQRIRIVEFGEEFVETDWCTNGHLGYVLEGELEINLSGQITAFRKGDGIFLPPGQLHKHKHHATILPTRLFLVEQTDDK